MAKQKVTIEQMENIHHAGKRHFIIRKGVTTYLQSYNALVAVVRNGKVTLDRYWWQYCTQTTAAYRNRFLGLSTKEIASRIASGEYRLRNLDSRILCELNPAGVC